MRPVTAHQHGGKERSGNGSNRPEEQGSGRNKRMLAGGCVVIGVGRAQGIERHGEGTEGEDAQIIEPDTFARHLRQENAGDKGAESGDEDDQPPVQLVRIMPQRILQHHTGKDARAHEGGDRGDRHADPVRIDGAKRAEAGVGEAHDDAADGRQR